MAKTSALSRTIKLSFGPHANTCSQALSLPRVLLARWAFAIGPMVVVAGALSKLPEGLLYVHPRVCRAFEARAGG